MSIVPPTIKAEKVDNFAYYEKSNIKRLDMVTVNPDNCTTYPLTIGNNYYKVNVVSQNNEYSKDYNLTLYVPEN